MNTSNNNIKDYLLAKLAFVRDWVMEHAKIVMPVVLLACVIIAVIIAFNARNRKAQEEEATVSVSEVEVAPNLIAIPEVTMEQDAVPEINALFTTYYEARVNGDITTMSAIVDHLDETEILRAQETSKYIEGYPTLEVYTKVGPRPDSYIAYVYSELKFKDYEKPIPGMQVYYVCKNDAGQYYINEDGEEDQNELNYIREVNLQDDAIDLSNRAAVAYNDMLVEDENLATFLLDLNTEIEKNVGEALAKEEGSESDEGEVTDENTEPEEQEPEVIVTKVKAIDVVNIRTSDSETADKLGKAAIGDEFELVEKRGNGWSKIIYEGKEAFIKSEYLEDSETQTASEDTTDTQTEDAQEETQGNTQTQNTDASTDKTTGTVTVKENVRIRSGASETADKIATAYVGEKLDVIMKQADGWTKIKYNGKIAYVKSEFVE